MRYLCAILLFSLLGINSNGQIFLGLDKGGRNKRIRFFVGDIITFKTDRSKKFINGRIENIGDSISISGTNYSLNDFHKIKTHPEIGTEYLLLSGAIYFPISAGLFLVSEAVSSQLHGDYPLVETKHLKLTAGLLLGGFIMYELSHKTYRINERHPLRVFNLNPKID